MNYHWNWKIFWDLSPTGDGTYLHTLFVGLMWTLATSLTAWVIALLLWSVLGVLRTTPYKCSSKSPSGVDGGWTRRTSPTASRRFRTRS